MGKPSGSVMDRIMALCKRRGFIFQSSEIYGGINGFWDYGPLGVELKRNVKDAWWEDMVRQPPDGPVGQPISMVGLDSTIIMNPKVWVASGHVGGFSDPMQTCRQCKKLFRADQVEDMHEESEWYKELKEVWHSSQRVDFGALRKWAQKRGRKLAPGLGLVRETEAVIKALEQAIPGDDPIEWANNKQAISNLLFNSNGQQYESETCPNCGGDLTEPREFNLMFESHAGAVKDEENKVYLRPETAQGIFANFKNVIDSTR
ncbi:MAG: glycine--tRNA ligase, partial [Planctomycetota bacterium]